jgi:hypothetical protein
MCYSAFKTSVQNGRLRPRYKVWSAPTEKRRVPHHVGSMSHGGNGEECLLTVQFSSSFSKMLIYMSLLSAILCCIFHAGCCSLLACVTWSEKYVFGAVRIMRTNESVQRY